jgi:cysteinyl-tRNA synthetase
MQLYNTLTRAKEDFKELHEGKVGMYSCGPTVYNFAHIGNLRAFMCSDILKKYLKYKGYKVKHVMNITDVEDKIIRDSKKEGLSLKEFTEKYTKYFIDDLNVVGIELADVMPKATGYIDEMVALVKTLLDKGYAYRANDGIYFKISKFADYGKFAGIDVSQSKAGAGGRVSTDEYDKEHANDFALWKFWDENDGDVFWETEIGKGRPGWHIECSAMSAKNLGDQFDIHTGGIDLIFPHHQNEIAQSEAATGKKFVNYWFHNDYILVDGKKMSKSLGNFYTLKDILAKGHKPKAIRYLLLSAHYRQQLNFTFDALYAAQKAVDRLQELADKLVSISEGKVENVEENAEASSIIKSAKEKFEAAMDDDLNISTALGEIFEFVRQMNVLIADKKLSRQDASAALNALKAFDSILGVIDWSNGSGNAAIPAEIQQLLQDRESARKAKDWKAADAIRQKILEKGYVVSDTKDGPKLKKA